MKADNTNTIAELKALIAAETIEKALPIQVQAIEPDRQRVILMGRELQNGQVRDDPACIGGRLMASVNYRKLVILVLMSRRLFRYS